MILRKSKTFLCNRRARQTAQRWVWYVNTDRARFPPGPRYLLGPLSGPTSPTWKFHSLHHSSHWAVMQAGDEWVKELLKFIRCHAQTAFRAETCRKACQWLGNVTWKVIAIDLSKPTVFRINPENGAGRIDPCLKHEFPFPLYKLTEMDC